MPSEAAILLPEQDRATIAHELLRTLPGEAHPILDAESDRRLDEIDAGTAKGSPAAEMFVRLRAKRR